MGYDLPRFVDAIERDGEESILYVLRREGGEVVIKWYQMDGDDAI
jgi:hypothetical protein